MKKLSVTLIVALLLVAIIIFYLFTFGKINLLKENENEKRLKWIENRLSHLHYQFKTKEELRAKLDLKVKQYFFLTRILIASIFLFLNIICFFYWISKPDFYDRLSILLNYNQVLLLVILSALFIKFETSAELKDVIKLIHLEIKNIVYKNHEGLEDEVAKITGEITILNKEKYVLQEQLASNKSEEESNLLNVK
ncbi:MAG: hypothetical protein ACYDCN_13310 [Bacteroidia bacterium]